MHQEDCSKFSKQLKIICFPTPDAGTAAVNLSYSSYTSRPKVLLTHSYVDLIDTCKSSIKLTSRLT